MLTGLFIVLTGLLSAVPVSSQYENVTITSNGIDRWYLLTLPSDFNASSATPVIFSFHGGDENATEQMGLSQMSNPEFNDFAIAIYPQGINVRTSFTPLSALLTSVGFLARCSK